MAVKFHFQTPVRFGNRKNLKQFIPTLFQREKKRLGSLDIIFCNNSYLLSINKEYLRHDYYTDIISFDLSEPHNPAIAGEIYISIDMVKDNSIIYKTGFENELYRVIFHGALHLCGYKDKTDKDIKLMRAKEAQYLKMFHGEH